MEFITNYYGNVITLTEKKEGRSRRYFMEIADPRFSGGWIKAELTKAELKKIKKWIFETLGENQ